MKLGIANRITITNLDLEDTQDIRPSYSDCLGLFQRGDAECAALAQEWLGHMSPDSERTFR